MFKLLNGSVHCVNLALQLAYQFNLLLDSIIINSSLVTKYLDLFFINGIFILELFIFFPLQFKLNPR